MNNCETCRCNKVCDHNKYGFENCNSYISADVVEVVRCKDCDVPHNKWTGCPHLNGLIPPPDFYCAKGTPKERGDDKPKVTCLNCKHLEITLPYGECSRQLRIVKPDDTCEYAEPKERGGEK